MLNWPNGIEKAGAVSVESRDSSKIYCVYDNSLNTDNSDTLTLKQITVHPNNTISADTFLMYYNLGKLQVENKSKTIENVSLQKATTKYGKSSETITFPQNGTKLQTANLQETSVNMQIFMKMRLLHLRPKVIN